MPLGGQSALSRNAFRKFAEVGRILLYWPRETCTYTGDADPFPDSEASVPSAPSRHSPGQANLLPRPRGSRMVGHVHMDHVAAAAKPRNRKAANSLRDERPLVTADGAGVLFVMHHLFLIARKHSEATLAKLAGDV
jgi:hypothetical protein